MLLPAAPTWRFIWGSADKNTTLNVTLSLLETAALKAGFFFHLAFCDWLKCSFAVADMGLPLFHAGWPLGRPRPGRPVSPGP